MPPILAGFTFLCRGQYLLLRDTKSAKSNYVAGWEQDFDVTTTQLDHGWDSINCGWMAEWCEMCQGRPDPQMAERLETIAATHSEHYAAYTCRAIAKWLRGQGEESRSELEQAITIRPNGEKVYFWKGMVYASLGRDEEAITAIEKALKLRLPPVLLTPLRWFKQDRSEFYEKHVTPLLAHYDL